MQFGNPMGSRFYTVNLIQTHTHTVRVIPGRFGFRSTVSCNAVIELSLALVPIIALESPTFPITRFLPCKESYHKICGQNHNYLLFGMQLN